MKLETIVTIGIFTMLGIATFALLGGFDAHTNDAVMGLYKVILANGG